MRITFSKTLLLATTAFSMISVPAANAYLSPLSFNEMYAHASRGNLTVLNNAILRGMNINAVNGDGDTGICVAIRRGDHIAYESFRNTGAHTRPRCLNNINAKQYKKFMADHRPYELAYRKEGSSIWWWIGGAAAVGGIALAAGGGGGGGGSDPLSVPAPEDPTFHSNKGLGYVVATSDPSEPETTPYEPVMISAEDKTTEVNRESMQLSNNAKMWVYNPDTFGYDTILLSDLIDFDKDINSYTKYIRVGMRAYNDSVVINDTEQTISAGSGTVGLDALLNSSASNLGTIEISAPNGSIGMVASDYSEAGNTGTISMEFTGKDTADSLIGMYADTNSSLTNAGTISGKADTARGRVTGMQTRLTSYYADFVNKAVNSGKIELSGSSDNAGGMSLWGMSSWLDRAFIDGDKSAAKLDKATLTNKGDISLTFSLQPSDEEGAVDPEAPLTLAAGNGGIVGMHADANTTATNNGNITIAVTGDAGETLSAGMQAVRGGSIVNGSGKNITVSAEGSAYGMMAISGSNGGKNFTDVESAVDNRGSITVTAGDTAYGIYSTVKGDVKNSGKITINGAGYGIFNQNGSVNSSGSIIVAGTGEKGSYGIYAEAEAGSGNKITNAADITMTFAPEEEGGDDEEEQPTLPANYGIYGWNVDIENSGSVSITQQNEKSEDVFGIVSEESSINNSGTVVINGNGSAVYAGGGSLTNSGSITLNGDGYGLIAEDGDLTNSGTVTLNGYGYAVLNDGGNLTNGGEIYLNGSGWGVYAKNGNLINNAGGNVTVNADDLAAISGLTLEGSGYQLQNNARIVLTSTGAKVTKTAKAIDGGDSSVVNSGNITIGSSDVLFTDSYGIYNRGSSLTNSGSITVFGSGYGIYGKGSIDNSGSIAIHAENDAAPVYGIYGQNGSVIDNEGQINIASSKAVNTSAVFGIYGNSAEINNNGSIKIGDGGNLFNAATGIRADNKNVNNSGTVRIYGAGTAISAENGNIVNNSGGGITMVISGAADSYGIYLAGRGSNTLTNNATAKVNRSSAYAEGKKAVALYAENGSINNSGALEVGAKDAVINGGIGIETDGGNVTNGGTITVYGNGSAIKAADGSITNNASATVYGNGSVLNGQNGNVTNNEKGQLNIYTDGKASAYGIYLAGSTGNTITNKASIFINRYGAYAQAASTGNYGIWTDNAKIVNSGDISLGSSTAGLSGIYGLYAAGSGSIENSGVINLYGAGTAIYTASGTVNNTATSGIINIYTDGSADSFGIAAGSSNNGLISNSNKISITAQNGNASAKKNTGIAANNIKNSGTVQIGSSIQAIDKAIGLDGKSIDNDGEILLYGNNAAGIFSDDENADITNNGRIELNGNGGIGISVTGGNGTVTNTGAITVTSSGQAYGIKNEAGSVENNAVITMNASGSYGILAKNIENSGEIYINKSSGNGYIWAAYAEGSGSIKNSGTIYVDKATDLIFSGNVTNNGTIEAAAGRMLLNEQVKFGSNARFVADEIAGTASVSADTVKQSNRTQFVLSGNFEGNTDRLNVRSESYLFDADFDGEKTTLSMKKFAEVENNASIAGFLQNNYGRNNNSDLFDELKSASSQKELTKRISQISGRDVIPTMAEQNLALMKDLHRQFDNAWFNAAPDDKLIAGFNYYDRERGGYGNFAGSDDNAVSLFGIFRNNEGKNVSYGLGWSISKFDSKYDNGGKKDEVIAEILLPFGFGNENFRFLGNMYGGYGNGEYKRYAEGGRFTGDVENYYYGVNNELRGSFDAGFGISLQPTAEFNVAGLYQSGIDDGGLKTGHNNNLSVESGFGLYAEKEFLFNDENSLRLRFGGTWYHEFNDKYQTVKARLDGMEGRFAMDRAEYEKDRGLFSLNGEYRNGGFSFYGETAFEAGRSDNWIFNTGFKYAF